MEESLNPISNDFVLGSTKTGSEVLESSDISAFKNEIEVSRIDFGIHLTMSRGVDTKFEEERGKSIPIFLIHERMHTIRSRSLKRLEREESSLDFSKSRYGILKRVTSS